MADEVVVMMPPVEEMMEKLTKAGVYGKEEVEDRFLRSFVEKVAGSKKVGQGLVMAWMLSEYDVLRDYPPVISGLIRFNFDEVIDAVTPDVKVAEKAKAFLKEALDKTGKK